MRVRLSSACGALALGVAAAACGSHATSDSGTPSPNPSPTANASAGATTAPATAPPVNFHGQRVGSRYVYATKQDGTHKVYVLRADSVNAVYNGATTGRSNFVNPHVVFYGEAGKRLTSDAPAGTVVEKDKTVLMTGGVHARTQDGMTLTSDTLRYDDASQIVYGVGHVVVSFPAGEQLQGQTVDWNLRDGHINVGAAGP